MFTRLALIALCCLTACGAFKEGAACTTEDSGGCEDSSTALLCEGGSLHAYKCRGMGGCSSSDGTAVCDFSASVVGEACPKRYDSKALCDSHDANGLLLCTDGLWTAHACKACSVQGGNVICAH